MMSINNDFDTSLGAPGTILHNIRTADRICLGQCWHNKKINQGRSFQLTPLWLHNYCSSRDGSKSFRTLRLARNQFDNSILTDEYGSFLHFFSNKHNCCSLSLHNTSRAIYIARYVATENSNGRHVTAIRRAHWPAACPLQILLRPTRGRLIFMRCDLFIVVTSSIFTLPDPP